jgi:aspartyl aminopeptidase
MKPMLSVLTHKYIKSRWSEEYFNLSLMYFAFILLQLIAREANCEVDDICDFELQLCDTQPSIIAGAMKEFIFSGRLDNLCMSFCSLKVCLAV